MGTGVHLQGYTGMGHAVSSDSGESGYESSGRTMTDVLERCSAVIGSSIAERIHELGGSHRDVQSIATSAAYAIFVWSAAEALGR